MATAGSAIVWLQRFFASWRFAAIALSVLLSFALLLILVLLVPGADRGFGAFAEQMRVWCFGYDAAKGTVGHAQVGMALAEPALLGAIIASLWWRPLRGVVRDRPRALVPYVGVATVLVAGGALALAATTREARASGDLPFPAADLRTSLAPPRVELTDHEGEHVSLAAMRGRVVVLTGVYASCGYACPMILGQARRAVGALAPEERRDVRLVAVTLDPEHDGRDSLAAMALAQGVSAPSFRLSWGPADEVELTLDALSIPRTRDPATGVIDHANVFVLVDRSGRIAYRLGLGGEQERWLVEALRTLLREPAPAGA